jgi:N-methylhydantoinase A/oxoprolinase/acetone carboxylase beta subunit
MAPELPSAVEWLGTGDRGKLLILRPETTPGGKADELTAFLASHGQATPEMIRSSTGLSGVPLSRDLEQLTRRQQIYECGFTPTDALHVIERISLGDRKRAVEGAEVLAAALGLDVESFCELVIRQTEEQIENLVIDHLIQHYWGNSLAGFLSTRHNHPVLGVEFSLKIPLIGIGAAARHFLPRVAERLATTVTFPENCEVGNAIGAALVCLDSEL